MKAKDTGSEFSDIVLAFNLLEACKLKDTDEKFVLTAVDFKKGKEDKNMLAQVKASLRKFQSRESLNELNMKGKIQVDEALVSNIKETLVSEGWIQPSRKGGDKSTVPRNSPYYKGN